MQIQYSEKSKEYFKICSKCGKVYRSKAENNLDARGELANYFPLSFTSSDGLAVSCRECRELR